MVGSRGLGGFAGLLLGSVGAAVAAHAACPVVVVRGAADAQQDGPILVGVDGSPQSDAALAFAVEAAVARRAPLRAVHAWMDSVVPVVVSEPVDWDEVVKKEASVLTERLTGWREAPGPTRRAHRRARPSRACADGEKRGRAARGGRLPWPRRAGRNAVGFGQPGAVTPRWVPRRGGAMTPECALAGLGHGLVHGGRAGQHHDAATANASPVSTGPHQPGRIASPRSRTPRSPGTAVSDTIMTAVSRATLIKAKARE